MCRLGCPTIIRCDCGTENTEVAACHMSMRHNQSDQFKGENSVRYGASTTNTVNLKLFCSHRNFNAYLYFRGLKVGGHNYGTQ